MFIKDGKRFNPYATHVFGGVTFDGNILRFPKVVELLGIQEVPDPTPPEDYSDVLYFRNEQEDAPYVTYTRKPQEMIDQTIETRQRDEAQRYLDDTDYLFSTDRHMELITQEPAREELLRGKRKEAREVIRAYKVKYPEFRTEQGVIA